MACIALLNCFFCFFVAFVLQSGLAPRSLIFLVVWQLCFERLIIAGLSDGLAVVLCLVILCHILLICPQLPKLFFQC